jgi:TnpA family transposase
LKEFVERITILSPNEIDGIYKLPQLSEEERFLYFTMDADEYAIAHSHRSLDTKVFFILQLGYFKAKRMFFSFTNNEIKEDLEFIKNKYFPTESISYTFNIVKSTRWYQQQKILSLFSYHDCDTNWKESLQERARRCIKISARPIYMFKDLLDYLEKAKVVLPAYSTMQKIISKAIIEERERLSVFAKQYITKDVETRLQELLTLDDNSYILTLLKKEPKDFSHKQISREITKQKRLKPIYDFANCFLPLLEVSDDNINYYAAFVEYYSIFSIRRFSKLLAYIYLICFVYHRYQRINDNLANTFIYHVRKYEAAAKLASKNSIYELRMENNQQLGNTGKILDLFVDDKISDETPFGEVRQLAFSLLEKNKFSTVTTYISKTGFDQVELEWKASEKLSPTFKKNIRPILMSLDFVSTSKKDSLIDAVSFLKLRIEEKKALSGIAPDLFPKGFINRKLKRYIIQKKKIKVHGSLRKFTEIRTNRYEFLVYSLLRQSLASGDIYIRDSVRFRSFEDDLINDKQWENKDQLIRELNLPILSNPIEETLSELKEELETLLVTVNQRIKNGENEGIKLAGSGTSISWTLPYKKQEDTTNHPIFANLPQIEIRELLSFVDSHCGFMSAFTHRMGHYLKSESDNDYIAGAVIALATNKGLFKMAESSDVTYQTLFSATKSYLTAENLHNANDKISNALFNLSAFTHFNIAEGTIHSSSDGQKVETQKDTINARHSPKYFGLSKGVSGYTLVSNNVPVNAKIIGANEHESHFVFDILYNNTSNIQSDLHSVDTHGTNKVNFLILHAFLYVFAPRYKDIRSQTESLCAFKDMDHYEDMLLKPSKKIREQCIIAEWPNIQKILVSLGLKNTTQSVIIGKLSSYARKNRTKRAMWELDNIYKSIYILKYIDNLTLRQNVQKALNRGEAYHQLHRAIFHENAGKFHVDTEKEQHIWNECSRLVGNAIIFYNTFLLSKLLEQIDITKKLEIIKRIERVSPIAWQHINLGGRFDLTGQKEPPEIDLLINQLNDFLS